MRTHDRGPRFASIVAVFGCTASNPVVVAQSPEPPPRAIVEPEPTVAPPRPADPTAARPLHAGRVLVSNAADPSWAEGPALFVEANRYHETWQIERNINSNVPADLLRFLGMTVDLYGPSGRVCTVVLETLTLEAHVAMDGVGGHEANPSAEELWNALSEPAEHELFLVASFQENSRCLDALWARDASLPAPELLVPGDAAEHGELLAAEHRRVLASEPGHAFADKYAKYAADPDYAEDALPWSTVSEGRRDVWVDGTGTPRVVSLDFGSHEYTPCHFQGPAYSVVRSLAGEGEDLFIEAASASPPPVAVFDADLDGRWEMVVVKTNGDFELVYLRSETPALQVGIDLPDHSWVWC